MEPLSDHCDDVDKRPVAHWSIEPAIEACASPGDSSTLPTKSKATDMPSEEALSTDMVSAGSAAWLDKDPKARSVGPAPAMRCADHMSESTSLTCG